MVAVPTIPGMDKTVASMLGLRCSENLVWEWIRLNRLTDATDQMKKIGFNWIELSATANILNSWSTLLKLTKTNVCMTIISSSDYKEHVMFWSMIWFLILSMFNVEENFQYAVL